MKGNNPDDELTAEIAVDVMRVVSRRGFFEKLDDKLCHVGDVNAETCAGGYAISELLHTLGFDEEELKDIFQVFRSRGGFCDCEILYNVSETNRLKTRHWRGRAVELDARIRHSPSS